MAHRLCRARRARSSKQRQSVASGAAILLACMMFVSLVHAKTIFDGDWTPPQPTDLTSTPSNRPTARQRRAIPTPAELAVSHNLFKDVYSADLANRSAAGRRALARKLLDQARTISDTPSDQFLLLLGAIDAAREGSDLALVSRAANALTEAFEVDGLKIESNAAVDMSLHADSAEISSANCRIGMELADQLATAEDFSKAVLLLRNLQAAAPDAKLRSRIRDKIDEVNGLAASANRIAVLTRKLQTSPNDPEANTVVGQHLCYEKNDWIHGLPLLAKGSDGAARSLALKELNAGPDASARAEVADGWWTLADTETATARANIRRHAATIYDEVLPNLSELARAVASKRIAEIADGLDRPSVDLLQLIDVKKDTVSGDFSLTPSGLSVQAAENPRLQIPYRLPEEYDLNLEFTYTGDDAAIVLILPLADGPVELEFRSNGIDFKNDAGSPIKAMPPYAIRGQSNLVCVRVRRDVVQAYLGPRLAIEYKPAGNPIGMKKSWLLRSNDALGVGCYHSYAVIGKLTLVEITAMAAESRNRRDGIKREDVMPDFLFTFYVARFTPTATTVLFEE